MLFQEFVSANAKRSPGILPTAMKCRTLSQDRRPRDGPFSQRLPAIRKVHDELAVLLWIRTVFQNRKKTRPGQNSNVCLVPQVRRGR